MIIITLLVLAGAALYFMTPQERLRLRDATVALLRRLAGEAVRLHAQHKAAAAEDTTPRPRPIVTLVLAGTIVATYLFAALAPGDLADPDTLVAWGANFGPRTTNGEWWRLVTASFLHAGVIGLLINLAALLQVSFVLERVGARPTLVAVYLFAGVFAGLVCLSVQPVAVIAGASGGIFGLYGLLLASWMWGLIDRSAAVRLPVVAGLAPGALIFVLYQLTNGELVGPAQTASVVTGFFSGLVLARGAHERRPPAMRMAATIATTAIIAVVSAVPLRGLTDIREHVARLISVEKATAAAYDEEVAEFRKGRTTADALSRLIEQHILPELQAAGARLIDLKGVPDAHQPLSSAAQRFFTMRVESWQLRLRGLRKGSMPMLREADSIESRSLDLFRKVIAGQPSAS
jgi:membrane associated rhomboid family serine protease